MRSDVPKLRLLIVEDNAEYLRTLERALADAFAIRVAANLRAALDALAMGRYDAALLDIRLDASDETNRDGLDVLGMIAQEGLDIPVIVMTAFETPELVDIALRRGAVDFVSKAQSSPKEVEQRVKFAIDRYSDSRRADSLQERLSEVEPHEILGESFSMQQARSFITALANSPAAPALIHGEVGTGKRLVARAVHAAGPRQRGPLVFVDLSAVQPSDHARMLFGERDRTEVRSIGAIRKGNRGVVILHQVEHLDLSAQGALEQVLATGNVSPIGGGRPLPADTQVLCLSSQDIGSLVAGGAFREDLYRRLQAMELFLAPLRQRREDIALLARHFVQRDGSAAQPYVKGLAGDAARTLLRCPWPGNVLQLETAIRSGVIAARAEATPYIAVRHLPATIYETPGELLSASDVLALPPEGCDVDERKAYVELELIRQAIQQQGGNNAHAWQRLGYNDRKVLYRRLEAIRQRYPHLLADSDP